MYLSANGDKPAECLYPQQENEPRESTTNSRTPLFIAAAHLAAYSGAILYLDQAWYANYPRSRFHLHNDMQDWLLMDKGGHLVSAYQLSRISTRAFELGGLDKKSSALWGTLSSLSFLGTIEILDGHSEEWGFSAGDMAANIIGAASFNLQHVFLKNRLFDWKYSFQGSGLSKYRPDLLGYNTLENMIKDYNGITYWLSFNLSSALPSNDNIPNWLNVAIGYGAHGLLGGRENPPEFNGIMIPPHERYRQWYLSPDIDFSKIPAANNIVKLLFSALNILKMPAPAIEYNRINGWSFHFIYF